MGLELGLAAVVSSAASPAPTQAAEVCWKSPGIGWPHSHVWLIGGWLVWLSSPLCCHFSCLALACYMAAVLQVQQRRQDLISSSF